MPTAPPKLSDLIRTWLKTELTKAPQTEKDGTLTLSIMQGTTALFRVNIADGYLSVSGAFTSLEEYFSIEEDRVVGGKWSSGEVILACDPEFFMKLARCMSIAATVVTMGAFSPGGAK